jgi:hypothetical protein
MIFAGFPATMQRAGTSLVTQLWAPMIASDPILTPFMIAAPNPIHTSSPISIFSLFPPYESLFPREGQWPLPVGLIDRAQGRVTRYRVRDSADADDKACGR